MQSHETNRLRIFHLVEMSHFFICLPASILEDILTNWCDSPSVLSNWGACCRAFACGDSDSLWLSLYKQATGRMNSLRVVSRSALQPRVSLFRSIRLSVQRWTHGVMSYGRGLLLMQDSPKRLMKIICGDSYDSFKGNRLHLHNDTSWLVSSKFMQATSKNVLGELMIYAAFRQRWQSVKILLQECHTDINFTSSFGGETVLIIASWHGATRVVEWIVKNYHNKGLDVERRATLAVTSACGGKGPYTAIEWAQRKANVCPEKMKDYKKCCDLISKCLSISSS